MACAEIISSENDEATCAFSETEGFQQSADANLEFSDDFTNNLKKRVTSVVRSAQYSLQLGSGCMAPIGVQ